MEQSLLVTVRFHDGRYHGTGDWPPCPARLFQALLAGAARGAHVPDEVRRSLDWLEQLPPPTVAAPAGKRGVAYTNFVPNNDIDAKLAPGSKADYGKSVAATRVGKRIQPVLFSSDVPLLYCWRIDEDCEHVTTLKSGFNELYQLGRGVDMAWAEAQVVNALEAQERLQQHRGTVYGPSGGVTAGSTDMLCPRPGSRESLTVRFEATRNRFRLGKTAGKRHTIFAQPPRPYVVKHTYAALPERIVFELREGGERARHYGYFPSKLDKVSQLIEEIRNKASECLCDAAPDLKGLVERYLIGRGATDEDKLARVQIVPVPSIGHREADMGVRRIAVQVPQACKIAADDLKWAFSQVARVDDDGVAVWELHLGSSDDRVFGRYLGGALRWRSVTPLVLPIEVGFRKKRVPLRYGRVVGSERVEEESRAISAVYKALRHADVTAAVASVRVQREAFDRRGARAELFSVGTRFSRELLWHVEIVFRERVLGPLLLGNGRYLGLGLLCPPEATRGVIAFKIESGLVGRPEAFLVTQAARRAMMARVQSDALREPLPAYVSGHEKDGGPASSKQHRHLAVVADLAQHRLLFFSPHMLQRNGIAWRDVARDHGKVEKALEGMDDLRAGKAGRLVLSPTIVDEQDDPLFAPARVWESVTPYHVTRHRRHSDNKEALRLDIISELQRIGWPRITPEDVEVFEIRDGQRGGLSGRLRLIFPAAEEGPLLIGRTMHRGGGLFMGRKNS